MIRGTLGFGVCDTRGAALSFDLPAGAGNPGNPSFDNSIFSAPPGTGSAGAAAKWNGNQMFTRIFDPQSQWCIGFNLLPFYQVGSSTAWAQDKFLQLANPSGVNVLALELQTDGTIGIVTGGDGTTGTGTLQAKTTATFPVSPSPFPPAASFWSGYLELQAVGLGGSTVVSLFLNDVLILTVACSTAAAPDRISIGTQNGHTNGVNAQPYFGLCYANVYFADGQGPLPWSSRLGPIRITTQSPNADAGGVWNITPNTILNRYQAVADLFPSDSNGSPDFDNSYVNPLTLSNNNQWFTFGGAPCYGLVLGVMVNLVFRGASGSTTCDALLLQQTNQLKIGTVTVNGPYQTKQLFQGLSLATGLYFTDAEIRGALWGVSTGSPGLMLTQMFLEKIVSLRNSPYSCGQSSYSF